jgi:hypothetical protein
MLGIEETVHGLESCHLIYLTRGVGGVSNASKAVALQLPRVLRLVQVRSETFAYSRKPPTHLPLYLSTSFVNGRTHIMGERTHPIPLLVFG